VAAAAVRPEDAARRALVADLGALVTRAERYGLRARRAAAWRARLRTGDDGTDALHAAEQRLRAWVERRRAEPYAGRSEAPAADAPAAAAAGPASVSRPGSSRT
jgi:hypothetical protein